jgi:fatty acid desaturase
VFAAHGAFVFAPVYLAAALGPGAITILCWLWFGLFSHGFLLLLHECLHRLAFREVRRNETLGRWLMAPLFMTDFDAFRTRHWAHHRELGEAGDPKFTYRTDIRGSRLVVLVAAELTGIAAVRKLLQQVGRHSGATRTSSLRALKITIAVQSGLFATLLFSAWIGHPGNFSGAAVSALVAYLGVYAYGLVSLTDLMHTLRGIAEHRRTASDTLVVHDAALRNFSGGAVERLLFATYGFADHATHHRFPGLPSYLLPHATRELAATDRDYVPVGSHFDMVMRLVCGR